MDLPEKEPAVEILRGLRGKLEWVKIGLQMYLIYGAELVREVSAMGFKIFLDLKLFDIPNTVASAVESVAALPVSMLTIHASGGREMIEAAVKAAERTNPDLAILGVTVLTSQSSRFRAESGGSCALRSKSGGCAASCRRALRSSPREYAPRGRRPTSRSG